jgi:hypothetical protein
MSAMQMCLCLFVGVLTTLRRINNFRFFHRLANSALADAAVIKPMFGAASRMGKVIAPVPAKLTNKMEGAFSANLNGFLSKGPAGLGSPNHVLKVYVRH